MLATNGKPNEPAWVKQKGQCSKCIAGECEAGMCPAGKWASGDGDAAAVGGDKLEAGETNPSESALLVDGGKAVLLAGDEANWFDWEMAALLSCHALLLLSGRVAVLSVCAVAVLVAGWVAPLFECGAWDVPKAIPG
jgi:hypothetical protein